MAWSVPSEAAMTVRESVEAVIERIRPALNADGGDLELVRFEGSVAHVRLLGLCAGCPSAAMTLQTGVEGAIRRFHPDIRVVAVE
jgi:Fe-S cluster biogenesis protein NfuA